MTTPYFRRSLVYNNQALAGCGPLQVFFIWNCGRCSYWVSDDNIDTTLFTTTNYNDAMTFFNNECKSRGLIT